MNRTVAARARSRVPWRGRTPPLRGLPSRYRTGHLSSRRRGPAKNKQFQVCKRARCAGSTTNDGDGTTAVAVVASINEGTCNIACQVSQQPTQWAGGGGGRESLKMESKSQRLNRSQGLSPRKKRRGLVGEGWANGQTEFFPNCILLALFARPGRHPSHKEKQGRGRTTLPSRASFVGVYSSLSICYATRVLWKE